MAHIGALPKIHRYITAHDAAGKAVFSSAFNEECRPKPGPDGIAMALSFTTKNFPINMNADADLDVYGEHLKNHPGLTVPSGTALHHVDIPPETSCEMHQTMSLDYACVLEGEVELLLDSGEKRLLKRGDIAVQRGTMHQWTNHSKGEWARMLFVLIESEPLKVGEEAKA